MIEIADIKASIQSKILIQDETFRNADFLRDSRGRLIAYTGGYTVVFPCIVNDEKWAFRCWHSPVEDAKNRYTHISKEIKRLNLPFFSSFEYEEKGILVKGKTYPITKMKWINGLDLKKYICANYLEGELIKKLADNFFNLISQLHKNQISHGDLQHGNILVSSVGELFLVDYDSVYVSSMGNKCLDVIAGLIDYQHPSRKKNKYASEKLDYFSELVIYTSLLAIVENPELVNKYDVENTEALLFTYKDFESFRDSHIYNDLKSLKKSNIDRCLFVLEEYLSKDNIDDLKPIEYYLMTIDVECPQIVPVGEKFIIRWKTEGAKRAYLSDVGDIELNGEIELLFSEAKTVRFTLISETGCEINKEINIKVSKRASIINFNADKFFTLASVPIKLSWNCSNAKSVVIVGMGRQKECGEVVVYPEKDTNYIIEVEDEFRIQSKTLTIRMLPLPVVKTILVPAPQINKNIGIAYNPPQFNVLAPIPTIESGLCKLNLPEVPNLKESAYFVYSMANEKKTKNIFQSLFSFFKRNFTRKK